MTNTSCIVIADRYVPTRRYGDANSIGFEPATMSHRVRWPDGTEESVAAERVMSNRRAGR